MQVLQWNFSQRFEVMEGWVKSNYNILTKYLYTREHNFWYQRDPHVKGLNDIVAGHIMVYLNQPLSDDEAEERAAHELLHGVMVIEGYPQVYLNGDLPEDMREAAFNIGLSFENMFHHLVLRPRLLEFGYQGEAVNYFKNLVNTLARRNEITSNTLKYPVFDYIESHYLAPDEIKDELEGLFDKNAALAKETAMACIQKIDARGYDTPRNMYRSMLALRNILGLQNLVLIKHYESGDFV